jgi:hypothetical protein
MPQDFEYILDEYKTPDGFMTEDYLFLRPPLIQDFYAELADYAKFEIPRIFSTRLKKDFEDICNDVFIYIIESIQRGKHFPVDSLEHAQNLYKDIFNKKSSDFYCSKSKSPSTTDIDEFLNLTTSLFGDAAWEKRLMMQDCLRAGAANAANTTKAVLLRCLNRYDEFVECKSLRDIEELYGKQFGPNVRNNLYKFLKSVAKELEIAV